MIQGTVTGVTELNRAFKALSDDLKSGVLESALLKGAIPLHSAMVAAANVSENGSRGNRLASRNHPAGTLKRSIKILKSSSGGAFPTIWVKPVKGQGDPDGWYAKFVEYGHFVRKGNKGISGRIKKSDHVEFVKARPFIRPTYDRMDSSVKAIITAEIMNKVSQYIKS